MRTSTYNWFTRLTWIARQTAVQRSESSRSSRAEALRWTQRKLIVTYRSVPLRRSISPAVRLLERQTKLIMLVDEARERPDLISK